MCNIGPHLITLLNIHYCRLKATSAKNIYKKESRFFLEIHGKACWKEVKLKSNYAEHHETFDSYISMNEHPCLPLDNNFLDVFRILHY